ncbi:MAG TPA: hypothetical protein PLG22_11490 [Kiritimatiellia bacterium]|nr:hypothetical protein [Kiritimatiellia bacterium]
MKRMGWIVLGLTVGFAGSGRSADAFRAGAAKGNITPELGQAIVGNFLTSPASHVHDDLWARCLALEEGTTRVAFVVCDLLQFGRDVSDEARRLVQEETGMPAGNILVSAVHTHSGTSAYQPAYKKFVVRRIADTVRCALNNLAPARIGWATANEPRHVNNRRWYLKPGTVPANPFGGTNDVVKMNPDRCSKNLVKPAGPTDPEICLIAVQTPEGRPIALLANYTLHYVGGVRGSDISADYFGMFNDRMQELLGADRQDPPFISILSNGASGDINNIDFTKPGEKLPPYGKMRIVADDVAQKVHAAYQTIQWRDRVTLAAAFEEIELKLRRPTPEQLARARNILALKKAGTEPKLLEGIYAERTVSMSELPESDKFPLQAFLIGEVGIVTFPNEPFCEIGLELKRRSPFKPTFVVELAHGSFGYLPTPEQHTLGGYETWLGSNRLEIEASPKMIDRLLAMLARLRKN